MSRVNVCMHACATRMPVIRDAEDMEFVFDIT